MSRHRSLPISAFVSAVLAVLLGAGVSGCTSDPGAGAGGSSEAGTTANGAPRAPKTVDPASCPPLPEGFSYVNTVDASIAVELRYASAQNFTGSVVDGYERANAPVLRTDAAQALAAVQQQLADQGLGLLIYDGFRPTRAVADFVAWSKNDDVRTRAEYYPSLEKPELFELGYIAEQSGHSLGGTVDLTVIDLATGRPLDMGGSFDLFDERSHYAFTDVTTEQSSNRTLLRETMIAAGFAPYAQEWWHFSYPVPAEEPRLDFALEPCG